MSPRYTEHDHEHYERPRRRTRPRTKERPSYDDAADGVVVTVDRGRFTLDVDGRIVTAMKSRPLGRKGVVVGDRVRVVGDVTGADGALARIVEVRERDTVLRRTADDDDPVERVIVSNAEQLVVVTALADPDPQPRLIDRALVAAYDSGMKPLLCLTKADLRDPESLLSTYRSLGVPWVVTQGGYAVTVRRAREVTSAGGWVQPGAVSVGLFHDLDQDGTREPGDVPLADTVLGALAGVRAQREGAERQLPDRGHVAHRAVDDDPRPAVLDGRCGDEVAHERRLQRPAAVDDEHPPLTRFGEGRLDQGVVTVAAHGADDAAECRARAVVPQLQRAGLEVLAVLVVEVGGRRRPVRRRRGVVRHRRHPAFTARTGHWAWRRIRCAVEPRMSLPTGERWRSPMTTTDAECSSAASTRRCGRRRPSRRRTERWTSGSTSTSRGPGPPRCCW